MHHCLNFLGLDFIYGHTWIECIRIFSTWPRLTIFWTLASKIASLVCYISSPTGIQSKLKHNAHKKVHLNRTRNVWISFMFLLLFWRCALKPICTYTIQNYMVGFWLLSPFLIIFHTRKVTCCVIILQRHTNSYSDMDNLISIENMAYEIIIDIVLS